jgi:hypothetical protein
MNLTCVLVRAADLPAVFCLPLLPSMLHRVALVSASSKCKNGTRPLSLYIFDTGQLPVSKTVSTSQNFLQCVAHHDGSTLIKSLMTVINYRRCSALNNVVYLATGYWQQMVQMSAHSF